MLGSNVPQIGGFSTAFEYAEKWSCDCIQIYLTPSRTWKVPYISSDDIEAFTKLRKESKVKEIIAHVPFLVNLAACDKDILDHSMDRLFQEIQRADLLGIRKLVLHPGSYQRSSKLDGLVKLVTSLEDIMNWMQSTNIIINLEVMAGQGTMLCSNFDDFKFVFDNAKHLDNLGVCFDTAHAFIAGYDLRGYAGYNRIMNKFDKIVGISTIGVIHLNDAASSLGSCNDRHAPAGEGKMGMRVFHALLKDTRFQDIPMILEIPDREGKTGKCLESLRELQKREKPISEHEMLQASLFE